MVSEALHWHYVGIGITKLAPCWYWHYQAALALAPSDSLSDTHVLFSFWLLVTLAGPEYDDKPLHKVLLYPSCSDCERPFAPLSLEMSSTHATPPSGYCMRLYFEIPLPCFILHVPHILYLEIPCALISRYCMRSYLEITRVFISEGTSRLVLEGGMPPRSG